MKPTLRQQTEVNGHLVEFNDRSVFEAEILLVMAMHNQAETVRSAVESALSQKGIASLSILIVNDASTDNWPNALSPLLDSLHIAIIHCDFRKVYLVRNLGLKMSWILFPNMQWVGRLDGDDLLEHEYSVAHTLEEGLNKNSEARWILGGNSLRQNGQRLERENRPDESLFTREGLVKRLEMMAQGDPLGELPSCNLWLRQGTMNVFPAIRSAEDHWLVAFLLGRRTHEGAFASSTLFAKYSLSGSETIDNRQSQSYMDSRTYLLESALQWFGLGNGKRAQKIVLGWGNEGTVWLENGMVTKEFYPGVVKDEVVQEQAKGLPVSNFPQVTWEKKEACWNASYSFEPTEPLDRTTDQAVRNFLWACLEERVVCKDFSLRNSRVRNGEIFVVDIGRDIRPFAIRLFRDMCARIYLTQKLGWTDREMKKITRNLRDNESALREIEGFEAFYRKEVSAWFRSKGYGAKPVTTIAEKKAYPQVTLLIKASGMDAGTLDVQVRHIVGQLCCRHRFGEIVLALDSFEGGFLRQHAKGDFPLTVEKAEHLREQGILDRILVSPDQNQKDDVGATYRQWFGEVSTETHTTVGIPLFPQIWAFDQVKTRYVLQADIDVLVGRRDPEHDYLAEMLTALARPQTFSVGFNIAQPYDAPFKPYDAPEEGYTPEVRFGLLDLERVRGERPFPNRQKGGQFELGWYHAIAEYQQQHGWKSLRGGDVRTFYIHPPNDRKQDSEALYRVMDLLEQNRIPEEQFGEWDLVGDGTSWRYPERGEKVILLCMGRNTGTEKVARCLDSVFAQTFADWGMVIVDDGSDDSTPDYLLQATKAYREKTTLIRLPRRLGKMRNTVMVMEQVCTNPNSQIVVLDMDDALMHNQVLARLYQEVEKGADIVMGGMFRPDKPLRRYPHRFTETRKPHAGNVWTHLRSFRRGLFDAVPKDYFHMKSGWIETCDEFAMMVPMVERAQKCVSVPEYWYFHERTTPETPELREEKNRTIAHVLALSREGNT